MAIDAAQAASLLGAENARILVIALLSLSVYEWAITLDDEIQYFWTGSWGASRVLFLLNRYLNPSINILALICKLFPPESQHPGTLTTFIIIWEANRILVRGIQALFVSCVLALGVVQAMLVVRVWYLFAHSRAMRLAIAVSYLLTTTMSVYFAILAGTQLVVEEPLTRLHIRGCHASRPHKFWRLYLPSLVLHTVLYSMTAYRALRNRRMFKEAPILKRLVRDGGFFYFVVFISILFTAIGSFLEDDPSVNIPAIFSNFPVATTSIAASRVMLSIHSLAAKLGSDSAWLLNNVELSRVPWRRGATEGEIIVDRFGAGSEAETDEMYSPESESLSHSMASLKTSRVGKWTDETW
ncbi:hypothetical protein C8F01DRAFT_1261967 [Mycena amicta]|nr:hypothetical protein C8F01DRAFT_1261967 [Mycena amicta]